jgi:hypothetical protein
MTMRRFDITVFMRLANIDAMAFDTIVSEQLTILCRELLVVGEVVHRGGQTVAAHATRNTTRAMEGILQARGECLEGLRVAEVNVLPVRIRKH